MHCLTGSEITAKDTSSSFNSLLPFISFTGYSHFHSVTESLTESLPLPQHPAFLQGSPLDQNQDPENTYNTYTRRQLVCSVYITLTPQHHMAGPLL